MNKDALRSQAPSLDQDCSPVALNKLPELIGLTSIGDMTFGHLRGLQPYELRNLIGKDAFLWVSPWGWYTKTWNLI